MGYPWSFHKAGIHYRLEWVRCGKRNCRKCPHGPYWYAYWLSGVMLRKSYVGKKLAPEIERWAPGWAATAREDLRELGAAQAGDPPELELD